MIVCPVCEHAQAQGAECEVCGKKLLHGPAGIPAVAPLDGLEPTGHGGVEVGVERIGGLEPTGHAAVDAPYDPTPGVEPTRVAPVDVAVDPTPDVERTAAEAGEAPTAAPVFVTCRYCRTPAMPGERVCARCGMRLPVFDRAPEAPAAEAQLCTCGTPVRGALCPSCGARRA